MLAETGVRADLRELRKIVTIRKDKVCCERG